MGCTREHIGCKKIHHSAGKGSDGQELNGDGTHKKKARGGVRESSTGATWRSSLRKHVLIPNVARVNLHGVVTRMVRS